MCIMKDDLAGQRTRKSSFAARCTNHSVNPMCKIGHIDHWMHINISACGNVPCLVYSNENVSGQLSRNPK